MVIYSWTKGDREREREMGRERELNNSCFARSQAKRAALSIRALFKQLALVGHLLCIWFGWCAFLASTRSDLEQRLSQDMHEISDLRRLVAHEMRSKLWHEHQPRRRTTRCSGLDKNRRPGFFFFMIILGYNSVSGWFGLGGVFVWCIGIRLDFWGNNRFLGGLIRDDWIFPKKSLRKIRTFGLFVKPGYNLNTSQY